jgi:hypothetical protein
VDWPNVGADFTSPTYACTIAQDSYDYTASGTTTLSGSSPAHAVSTERKMTLTSGYALTDALTDAETMLADVTWGSSYTVDGATLAASPRAAYDGQLWTYKWTSYPVQKVLSAVTGPSWFGAGWWPWYSNPDIPYFLGIAISIDDVRLNPGGLLFALDSGFDHTAVGGGVWNTYTGIMSGMAYALKSRSDVTSGASECVQQWELELYEPGTGALSNGLSTFDESGSAEVAGSHRTRATGSIDCGGATRSDPQDLAPGDLIFSYGLLDLWRSDCGYYPDCCA